jgi:hypothetical protein
MRAIATLLVLGTATLGLPTPAAAQANCDWYANTAVKQQQENEKFKCGFKGDGWSADRKSHMGWCGSVAPDAWKKAAQTRDQELQACAARAK